MSDRFVDNYLTREDESIEEAKERLKEEQALREEMKKQKRN
ncbi:hypothetical protein [Clostridium sp. KNHs205]|nr:hypothetical protein [Clostridium sp. KNHs205]